MRIAIAMGRGRGTEATRSVARRAAELLLAGKVDYLLMSGRCSFTDDDPGDDATEAAEMKALAISLGVDEDYILTDEFARDTISNMVGSYRVLRLLGLRVTQLILVCIPHAPRRARYAARKVFRHSYRPGLTVVASDYRFPNPGEEARIMDEERKHYWATRLLLLFVWPGHLRAIQQRRLWLVHPGYRAWRSRATQPINLMA